MIVKSILPFIAIGFFLLALIFRHKPLLKRKRFRKEPISFFEEVLFSEGAFGKGAGALGWMFFAVYCASEVISYFTKGEYYETSLALVFLAFSLLLAALMVKPKTVVNEKGDDDLFFTITKIALITAVFYFPFSEIIINDSPILGDLLVYVTAKGTFAILNLFNVDVYMEDPPFIYSSQDPSFGVEIVLDCTAIQSMVLFIGLIFGITAPQKRKLKAFVVSVPTIFVLNLVRSAFVPAAYFGQWFGPQSFEIAHGMISRFGEMILLIAIAYAVFVILPEALDVIDDFFRVLKAVGYKRR